MRCLILLPFLVACAAPETNYEPTCESQEDLVITHHTYPDGVSRKSEELLCTNGCFKYVFVNDSSIQDSACE